jgi:hypothetical protein
MSKEEDQKGSEKLIQSDKAQSRPSLSSTGSKDSVALNRVPKRLKKTFFCALTLFLIGVVLLVVGLEESIRREDVFNGLTFGFIAILVLIPGAYYTCKFWKARNTKELEDRREILETIPEL